MSIRCLTVLAVVAALAGCGSAPVLHMQAGEPWNGGIWNSVLGYHGPANATVMGGPSR